MSPKKADPAVRTALLEQAANILATRGSDALTLRALAERAGTSTMALYTHFGSMGALRTELKELAFARLREHMAAVPETDQPLHDLAVLGVAYYANAIENPDLYRVMFKEHTDGDSEVGLDTFATLIHYVSRCNGPGMIQPPTDPAQLALQIWGAVHGLVDLHIAGLLSKQETLEALGSSVGNMLAGLGVPARRLHDLGPIIAGPH